MKRPQTPRPQIDLDELLNGNPTCEQVAEFFRVGEFHEEHYAVEAIDRWLVTNEEREEMNRLNLRIEDMLNGRVTGYESRLLAAELFHDWNVRLGFQYFRA